MILWSLSRMAAGLMLLMFPAFFFSGCAPAYLTRRPTVAEPMVRVALAHGLKSLTLGAQDTVWATDGTYKSPVIPGGSWTVRADRGRLRVDTGIGKVITEIGHKLSFSSQRPFYYNGQQIVWSLTVFPEGDSTLLAVVALPLEEYLIDVLFREMGNAGPAEFEALKAQAVTARSYAYAKLSKRTEMEYDLESDVSDQAFAPSKVVNPIFRKAVEKTRGQVITCQKKMFLPNYHSTCGGQTALHFEAWGRSDSLFPWAKAVRCDNCVASPKYRWTTSLSPGEIARRALGLADTTIPITDVRVMERGPSGRVQKLLISSQAGDTVLYRDRIRFQLSDKPLPSTWFDINCIRDDFGNVSSVEFTGRGYGHGVGLCQWGAMGMARKGKGYKKILKHYYRNVKLNKLY